MGTLFAIGAIGFWILLAVTVILIIYFVGVGNIDDDGDPSGTWATIVTAVALILTYFMGGRGAINDLFGALRDNPSIIVLIISIYILSGAVWSIIKWYFFVLNKRDQYVNDINKLDRELAAAINDLDRRAEPTSSKKLWNAITAEERPQLEERLTKQCETDKTNLRINSMPKAKEYKATLITWMCWWPFSAVWTIINDPVRRAFKRIYASLEGVYTKITEGVFKNV